MRQAITWFPQNLRHPGHPHQQKQQERSLCSPPPLPNPHCRLTYLEMNYSRLLTANTVQRIRVLICLWSSRMEGRRYNGHGYSKSTGLTGRRALATRLSRPTPAVAAGKRMPCPRPGSTATLPITRSRLYAPLLTERKRNTRQTCQVTKHGSVLVRSRVRCWENGAMEAMQEILRFLS